MAPIKKQFILSLDNQALKQGYDELEALINREITKQGGANVSLDKFLYGKPDLKNKLVELITKSFKEAGWSVKRDRGSDLRGDYWDNLLVT